LSAIASADVVGILKIHRVNLGHRNKLLQLDVVAGFGFQALQFGLGKLDVLVLDELIATDAIIALYRHVTHQAVIAVLNAGGAVILQPMKGDVWVLCGSVELNGDRYQPEEE